MKITYEFCTLKDVYIVNSVINHEHAFVAEKDPKPKAVYNAGGQRKGIPWIPAFLDAVTILKERRELPRVWVLC